MDSVHNSVLINVYLGTTPVLVVYTAVYNYVYNSGDCVGENRLLKISRICAYVLGDLLTLINRVINSV